MGIGLQVQPLHASRSSVFWGKCVQGWAPVRALTARSGWATGGPAREASMGIVDLRFAVLISEAAEA